MCRLLLYLGFYAALGATAHAESPDCAYDPARTHLSRIIAADSMNGPIYGQIVNDAVNKSHERILALYSHEIVLTFDDGPAARYTSIILDTLDRIASKQPSSRSAAWHSQGKKRYRR